MKKQHYIIIFLLILISVWCGFYVGTKYFNNEERPPVVQPSVAIEDPISDESVEVASIDNTEMTRLMGLDIVAVDKCIQLINEEYIIPVDNNKLVDAALNGMLKKLKSKKLNVAKIPQLPKTGSSHDRLEKLHTIYYKIMALYGKHTTESEMAYAALDGMLSSLNDPYSVVMTPKEYKLLNEFMTGGNYCGIGIYMEKNKTTGMMTVLNTVMGGTAALAGIKCGDTVLKINGVSVKGKGLDLISSMIRGKKKTPVTLLIKKPDGTLKQYKILRDVIHELSVTYEMKPNKIGYIKISLFGESTGSEFGQALENLKEEGVAGYLIDLRNNSGGFVSGAVDMCSTLLETGSLIVSVVNPRSGRNEVYKAYGATQTKLPIVILVNENSASSSEIAAGAFRDTGSAIIVGNKTFGKGIVQSLRDLRDGGAIKLTVAKYLTPKGSDINKRGLIPDYVVKMPPSQIGTDNDIQFKKGMELLTKKIQSKQSQRGQNN